MRAGGHHPGERALSTPDGSEFDPIASEYDRVRPSYPPALVDSACERARLRPGSRVLEIGCGTGQLTEMLVERGLKVDAVEPGEHLAAVARRRVGARSVQFHLGRFEDVTLPPESFEAVFSATAFHWVDPAVGWLKVARVLAPSGVFALLQASLPGLSEDELTAWRAVLPDAATWMPRDSYVRWSGATERMSNISELWTWLVKKELARPEAAELFTEPRLLVAPVAYEHTAAEYIALLRTTSTYQRLEPPLRPALEARIEAMIAAGGGVHQAVETATLVTACRATVAPAGVLG